MDQNSAQEALPQNFPGERTSSKTHATNRIVFAPLVILALFGIAGGSYYLGAKNNQPIRQQAAETTHALITSLPSPTSPETANWKVYQPAKGGYSIKFPTNGWDIRVYATNAFGPQTPEYADTVEAYPPGETGLPQDGITVGPLEYRDGNGKIYKTITSLSQIQSHDETYPSPWFVSMSSTPTTIDGHNAVIKEFVWKASPPPSFAGEWSNRTDKEWYVDMGNGKFLRISAFWDNTKPTYAPIFDQIAGTVTFSQ